MMKDVCCYLSCVNMQKCFLAVANAGWCLKTKSHHIKWRRIREKVTKCEVCYSGKGNTFVHFAHNVQRAKCHPQWTAEDPSPSHRSLTLRLISSIQKNWEESIHRSYGQQCSVMHIGEKKNCFLIHVSVCQKPVCMRQCKSWKWQTHLPSDHKTWSGFLSEVQKVASMISPEDVSSH